MYVAPAALVSWRRHLETGAVYGQLLSQIIVSGWRLMALDYSHKLQNMSFINHTVLAEELLACAREASIACFEAVLFKIAVMLCTG